MEKLIVRGGNRLVGTVKTSGAKNAVLPIIAASILGETPSHLDEIPKLDDVHTICRVLQYLGVKTDTSKEHELTLDTSKISAYEAPYELVRTMRASFVVLGPCWPGRDMPGFPSPEVALSEAVPSTCI